MNAALNKVVLEIDFVENYQLVNQNEIGDALFNCRKSLFLFALHGSLVKANRLQL